MSAGLRIARQPEPIVRESARVKTVAEKLDCDPGDVRRLLAAGELEGHGKGKRGVRIYLDSVADYQARRSIQTKARAPASEERPRRRRPAPASSAAHRAAMTELRRLRIV